MDPDIIKGLDPLADPSCHAKALAYFEQLKATNEGLEFCASALAQQTFREDHVNFFLWQVYEHHLKYRYLQLPDNIKQGVKASLMQWLQTYSKHDAMEDPVYLRNKAAQVFSLVFSLEYLGTWPTFIRDIMRTTLGENVRITEGGANIYLKILLAIDSEVVDRTIDHSNEVQSHNQLLKDTMRERCVSEMVASWLAIFSVSSLSEQNTCHCLQVIGAYVTWIDINLIANDRVMPLILGYLSRNHSSKIRESACECLKEIATKGMLPADKLTLVETLWCALQSSGVFHLLNVDEEIDFVIKLSRLVASMSSTLVFAWSRLQKTLNESQSNEKTLTMLNDSIDSKMPACLQFFEHEDDDVSAQCIDLLRDYLDMLKKMQPLTNLKEEMIEKVFYALVKKLKYDEDYRFSKEGEEEAEFQEFLRNIKVIFDNLALLSPQLVVRNVHSLISSTLSRWQSFPFNDVEVAIRLLYMLGESIPSNLSSQFSPDKSKTSPLHEMMTVVRFVLEEWGFNLIELTSIDLVTSGVSNHSHSAVRLQFFETIARYDRFFPVASSLDQHSTIIAGTTQAFFDRRGLRSDDPKLRSRCAYLMSRYVKTLGKLLSPYAGEILNELGKILVLSPINGVERLLSNDDQLFIYELAGNLIVNSHFEPEKKAVLMTTLLRPLVENFQPILENMKSVASEEGEPPKGGATKSLVYATTLNYMMSYASRTSKAFSNKSTISQSGCAAVYTDALKVFLQALDTNVHRQLLHTGVRQYLHRMVICLEEEVLPFVPLTIHHLLSNQESRSLHDFIPLLNQVINKFKTTIEPFLREVFMLVVRAVFDMLSRHSGALSDDDVRLIRRTYFQFLLALVTNNVVNVILLQANQDLQLVLSTLVQGAVESHDPVAQKICFTVLTKLVRNWSGEPAQSLHSFLHDNVVPACFMAPMSPHFDLGDAQTVLALNESASLIAAIYKREGVELENFLRLQYLPSLQLPPKKIEEYCQALKLTENRAFRAYLKAFFTQAKT